MGESKKRTKAELDRLKSYAKSLYITEGITNQKELSERVGVSVTTINKWINEGKWEQDRESGVLSKENDLRRLYANLTFYNDIIDDYKKEFNESEDADEKSKVLTCITKANDSLSKTGAAIRSLETDVNVKETKDALINFIKHVQSQQGNWEAARMITTCADTFIKSLL